MELADHAIRRALDELQSEFENGQPVRVPRVAARYGLDDRARERLLQLWCDRRAMRTQSLPSRVEPSPVVEAVLQGQTAADPPIAGEQPTALVRGVVVVMMSIARDRLMVVNSFCGGDAAPSLMMGLLTAFRVRVDTDRRTPSDGRRWRHSRRASRWHAATTALRR